jgi:ATP synthase protein I
MLASQRIPMPNDLPVRERNSFHKKALTLPGGCGRTYVKFYTNSSSALLQSLFVGRGRARRREVAFMKEDTRKALKLVGLASTLGLTIVIATFIGLALGLWLDKVFNTSPWLTVIFLILGIIAGFNNFYRFMSKRAKE